MLQCYEYDWHCPLQGPAEKVPQMPPNQHVLPTICRYITSLSSVEIDDYHLFLSLCCSVYMVHSCKLELTNACCFTAVFVILLP